MAGEIFIQQLAITRFNTIFGTVPLSKIEQLVCWLIGSLSLIVNLIAKKITVDKFGFIQCINLERADPNEFINKFTGWFESTQNKFAHALKDSKSGDADNERFAQFFQ